MCAPSTSASAMKMTRWYLAESRSNARARPGPDDLDDRRALGVLEHVGQRRLLHVEDLAADRQQRLELRVPGQLGRAERGVALDDEQLAAVVGASGSPPAWRGSAELASADLRRWFSRCSRAAIRVLAAAATLSSTRPGLLLAPRPRDSKNARSSAATTWATIRDAAGVPSTSLVCPSNCGSGSRTRDHRGQALQHVLLGDRLVPVLQQPGRAELLVQRPDQGPLEPGDVGAALGRGDHVDERPGHGVVAAVPAQRHVDPQLPLDVGGGQVALVVEHRHGLGELPGAGQPHHVGDRLARRQVGAELADPAVEPELGLGWPGPAVRVVSVSSAATSGLAGAIRSASDRSSWTRMVRPGTR